MGFTHDVLCINIVLLCVCDGGQDDEDDDEDDGVELDVVPLLLLLVCVLLLFELEVLFKLGGMHSHAFEGMDVRSITDSNSASEFSGDKPLIALNKENLPVVSPSVVLVPTEVPLLFLFTRHSSSRI